jgi:hypothetical protein
MVVEIVAIIPVMGEPSKPSPVQIGGQRLVSSYKAVNPHVEFLASD